MAQVRPRPRELNDLKGRIAEALVEAIFRRAGYQVSRTGRESQILRLIKKGSDEPLPDFLVRRSVKRGSAEPPLQTVEVKYRSSIQEFLRRDGVTEFSRAREQWPELLFVFVTDKPENGRSCFQAVDLREYVPGTNAATIDLHQTRDLDIYKTTVDEYGVLVKQIFPLLGSRLSVENSPREPQS